VHRSASDQERFAVAAGATPRRVCQRAYRHSASASPPPSLVQRSFDTKIRRGAFNKNGPTTRRGSRQPASAGWPIIWLGLMNPGPRWSVPRGGPIIECRWRTAGARFWNRDTNSGTPAAKPDRARTSHTVQVFDPFDRLAIGGRTADRQNIDRCAGVSADNLDKLSKPGGGLAGAQKKNLVQTLFPPLESPWSRMLT